MQKSDIAVLLEEFRRNGCAIGAFNCPSFDVMLGVMRAAATLDSPVIVQASVKTLRKTGERLFKGWFDLARKESGAHAYLHLDHCQDLAVIRRCVEAGWDMVMYDGSSACLETNVTNSRLALDIARAGGAALEAEIGGIGGAEDGADSSAHVADPESVRRFAQEAPVDCLAVGFGNVHGPYQDKARLRWDVLEAASRATAVPLVLHGGTGLTAAEFRLAIQRGCAKINISTALKEVYRSVLGGLAATDAEVEPGELHQRIINLTERTAAEHIQIFQAVVNPI